MADDVTPLLALLDAYAAMPDRFNQNLMLHESDDGDEIVEHAFRLWCSARQLPIEVVRVNKPELGSYLVLKTRTPGLGVTVFTRSQPYELPQPVPGVVIRMPPVARVVEPEEPKTIDEACARFSLLELD